jgi:polar amino acid transport system substrate-binding protein
MLKGRKLSYRYLGVLLIAATMAIAGGSSKVQSTDQSVVLKSLLQEIRDKGALRVGYAPADPHSIKDPNTGKWSGIAYDIMDSLAQALQVKHVAVDTTFADMIAGLDAGKFEVGAAINRRTARAVAVTFTEPYINGGSIFAVNKDKAKARTWQELDKTGTTIALVQGSAEDKTLTDLIKNATLLRLPDFDEVFLALLSGRANASFANLVGQAKRAKEHDWMRLIIPNPPLQIEGIAFALRKGYTYDDIQVFDIAVEDFLNKGGMDLARRKYEVADPSLYVNR